jgi:SSS family solute:Na+ symporter
VKASRISTILLMLVALLITSRITSISDVWIFIIECGAGLGLVLILRWYWWRINAWSEIAATITPFIAYFVSKKMMLWVFPNSFFFTVGATTLTWLLVTFLTKPTATETLHKFYLKVRPEGQWGPVKKALGIGHSKSSVPYLLLSWMSAVCMTYSILFCSGKFIFKEWNDAGFWFIIALAAFFVLRFSMNRSAGVDEHNTIHKA